MKGAPRSNQFDDIYFSAEDGLAETAHVFLNANNLPMAWADKSRFVIAETGFGTGLNFLSVWKLFEETANVDQTLDFISFEKYPLSVDDIRDALSPWAEYFDGRLQDMLDHYPLRVAGFHRVKINSQITLTLIFDDINAAIPTLQADVDCWFLDGFTPAKNPEMWSDIVFENMARLSHVGTAYATFTAAGDVRRGLQQAGFSVTKQKGFGHKRDMIAGQYEGGGDSLSSSRDLIVGSRIAIIGGGLAGTACAYVLKQYGFTPVIYEASSALATGASGNHIGLFNPRFTAYRDPTSEFFTPSFAMLSRFVRQIKDDINYMSSGALHLINSADKKKRFGNMVRNWMWHDDHMKLVDAKTASDLAGIPIDQDSVYIADAGSVSPEKLCAYYAQGVEVHYNAHVEDFDALEADAVIICNAAGANDFECLDWLPLTKVRGQITDVAQTEDTQNIKCNIHYGGYISKGYDGRHTLGATFQKWQGDTDVHDDDHDLNIENLENAVEVMKDQGFNVLSGRAGLRTASKDHFPVVGVVPDHENVYVSVAYGSHGLVGSLGAAHYLADLLRGGPHCFPVDTAKALAPQRFIDRAKRREGQWGRKLDNKSKGK